MTLPSPSLLSQCIKCTWTSTSVWQRNEQRRAERKPIKRSIVWEESATECYKITDILTSNGPFQRSFSKKLYHAPQSRRGIAIIRKIKTCPGWYFLELLELQQRLANKQEGWFFFSPTSLIMWKCNWLNPCFNKLLFCLFFEIFPQNADREWSVMNGVK